YPTKRWRASSKAGRCMHNPNGWTDRFPDTATYGAVIITYRQGWTSEHRQSIIYYSDMDILSQLRELRLQGMAGSWQVLTETRKHHELGLQEGLELIFSLLLIILFFHI